MTRAIRPVPLLNYILPEGYRLQGFRLPGRWWPYYRWRTASARGELLANRRAAYLDAWKHERETA